MQNNQFPQHIAIIMDGNRRWAKKNNLDIKLGHKEGAKNLEKITKYCNEIGIKYLTVYAFSTENWKRTSEEVGALMILLQNYLHDYSKRANTENIRIKVLGDIHSLKEDMQKSILNIIERTKDNTGITLCIAFNYGGRAELVHCFKEIYNKIQNNELTINDINEEIITDNLYTQDIPDPDLMIRTSGEQRLSGFLPWQSTYTELLFIDKLWPEFTKEDINDAIEAYKTRKINLGK